MGHYDCRSCGQLNCICHKYAPVSKPVERRIEIPAKTPEKPTTTKNFLDGKVNFARVDAARQILYGFIHCCDGIYIDGEKAFLFKGESQVATLNISGDQVVFKDMFEALYD